MTMTLDGFLQKIIADPLNAEPVWLVLADWLEEQGDPRFEFVRLMHQPGYRPDLSPLQRDERVRELLALGMQPVVPTIENSIGMRFALIPAGTFLMGSPKGEGRENEHPQHEVEITRSFWMGVTPVTQEQYQRIMSNNPSWFCASGRGKDRVNNLGTSQFPVEMVFWDDAVAFCEALSRLPEEKNAERIYSLPTEAEWEYACRGGASCHAPFHFGQSLSATQANVVDSELERPSAVGSYPANGFGLWDMHGNVWEWCHDWCGEEHYQISSSRDPKGSEAGGARVARGGSWLNKPGNCHSALRHWIDVDGHGSDVGVRLCFRLNL